MQTSPLFRALIEVEWQYYVTLTFGLNWNENRTRNKVERIFTWLRKVAIFHRGHRSLKDWKWIICEETGERGGRFHVHLLLADLKKPNRTHCYAMAHLWCEALKGGWAVIRPFDHSLAGVSYVLKSVSPSDARRIARLREDARASQNETLGADGVVLESLNGASLSGCWNFSDANAFEVGKMGTDEGPCGESQVTLSVILQDCLAWSTRGKSKERDLLARNKDKFRHWL